MTRPKISPRTFGKGIRSSWPSSELTPKSSSMVLMVVDFLATSTSTVKLWWSELSKITLGILVVRDSFLLITPHWTKQLFSTKPWFVSLQFEKQWKGIKLVALVDFIDSWIETGHEVNKSLSELMFAISSKLQKTKNIRFIGNMNLILFYTRVSYFYSVMTVFSFFFLWIC